MYDPSRPGSTWKPGARRAARRPRQPPAITWPLMKRKHQTFWLLGGVLVFSFMVLASWASRSVHESACRGNLFFLGAHIDEYELMYGAKPLPTVGEVANRPGHSWRVVLHASSHQDFAARYKFDEPWDSPNNIWAAIEAPSYFVCDNNRLPIRGFRGFTNYVAIVDGPQGALKPFDLEASNEEASIFLVEVPGSNIVWTEPRDISPSEVAALSEGNDPGGLCVLLTNRRVVRLSRRAILERLERGGE